MTLPFRPDIVVANLLALSSIHAAEFEEGANAWVSDQSDYFTLKKNTSFTPDASNVIQPMAGSPIAGVPSGAWIRSSFARSLPWTTQTAWFVNALTGSDAATGSAASQGSGNIGPLKTLTEFFRRVNLPAVINVAMVVSIGANTPQADAARAQIAFGPVGSLKLIGTGTTTLYTGSITARTTVVRSTNTPSAITDTALPAANSWAAFVSNGVRVRTTGGSNPGAVMWPVKDLGAKQARTSVPIIPNSALGPYSQANVTVAVNDTFVVEQLTVIDNLDLDIQVFNTGSAPQMIFQDLWFNNRFNFGDNEVQGSGLVTFYGCDVGSSTPAYGTGSFANCRFVTFGNQCGTVINAIGGACVGGGGFSPAPGSTVIMDLGLIVQGGQIFCAEGSRAWLADVGVFDSFAAGVKLEGSNCAKFVGALGALAVWGSGNTTFGVQIPGGVVQNYSTKVGLTITGTTNDVVIAATAKAWAAIPAIVSDIAAGVGTTLAGLISV